MKMINGTAIKKKKEKTIWYKRKVTQRIYFWIYIVDINRLKNLLIIIDIKKI